jgi:probable rRNA maturation factor
LNIYFFSENFRISFLKRKYIIERFEKIAFFENKFIGVVNFIFVNDIEIKILNSKYLNHYYPTDTISFNYSRNNFISGDIYISIETVKYNSFKFNCSIKIELLRVMIHGFLHLAGKNDKVSVEKLRMKKLEDVYLRLFK